MDRVEIGEPRTERVQAEPLGDDGDAGRVTIPLTAGGQEAAIVIDVAFVRVGRGLALMTFANVPAPLQDALRAGLTGKVAERLTAALA